MKNKKAPIAISLFLLALMLISRIGIHVFHDHTPIHSLDLSGNPIANTLMVDVLSDHSSDSDCPLCKLDSFQELFIEILVPFVSLLILWRPVADRLFLPISIVSIFSKGRGPPSLSIV